MLWTFEAISNLFPLTKERRIFSFWRRRFRQIARPSPQSISPEFSVLENKMNVAILKVLKTKVTTSTIKQQIDITEQERAYLVKEFGINHAYKTSDSLSSKLKRERHFPTYNGHRNFCKAESILFKIKNKKKFVYFDENLKSKKFQLNFPCILK